MKLKYKLFSGYLAIGVLALISWVLAFAGYRAVHTHFVATTQDILPGYRTMISAKQSALAMVVESRDYLRSGDEIHVQYARENADDLRESLRIYLEHEVHAGEGEKGTAEEMERGGLHLIDLCNGLIDSYQRGVSEETLSEGREEIHLRKDELFEMLDQRLAVHEQELLDAQNTIYQMIVNGTWTFLATSMLILASGLLIALYSAKSILEPIHKLGAGAEVIGSGDLDYRLDIKTGDEIEQLAAAFNGMADRLANMVNTLEQRVAERTRDLSVSEKRFRDVAESTADWVWEVDGAGRYTYCSESVADVLGYTPEEVLGKTPFEFMPPDEAARVGEVFAEIAADKRPIVDLENRNLTKDGREVVLLTNGVPILDSEGNLLGYRGVDKDITARKRAEAEIQRRLQEMTLLSQVTTVITSAVDMTDALHNVCAELARFLQVPQAGFAILNPERTAAEVVADYHPPSSSGAIGVVLPVAGNPSMAYILEHKAPLAVTDAQTDPLLAPVHELMRQRNVQSILIVPIIAGGEVIGTLGFDAFQRQVFNDSDIDLMQHVATQVGQVLIRKRAEEEIKRRGEELEALREISLAVTAQLELGEVLRNVVEQGCRLLDTKAGGIYLVDEAKNDLEFVVSYGYTRDYTGTRMAPDEGLCGRVLQSGEPLAVDDYSHWEGRSPDWEAEPLTAVLGVPLKRGEQVIGVLEFVESGRARGFGEHDVWLATLFASQAAIAIENARLYQAEQAARASADTLREISRAVGSTLELDEVLSLVLRQAKRVLAYDTASILLFAGGEPAMAAVTGYEDEELVKAEVSLHLNDSPILQAMARDQRPVVIGDVREDERWIWVSGTEDIRAWIGVPLLVRDEMIGVLMIDNTQPGSYTEADAAIAQALANQAAVAIENARLYQAEQRGREVAEALRETARVVNASLNLDEVLPLILEQLAQVIEYDSSAVLLLDDDRFKVTAGRGFPDMEAALRISFSADEDNLSSAVVRARRPLVIEDVQDDPRWQSIPATAHIHGWIGAPLIVRDRVIGVLTVDSRRLGAYSEEDGRLVFAFANQAAVAIENARLYEETQRRATELSVLYGVATAGATSLRLDEIIQRTLDALCETLRPDDAAILLLEPETEELVIRAWTGFPGGPKLMRRPVGIGIPGWVAQMGEPVLLADVRQDERYQACDADTRSELCVPLRVGERIIGALNLESRRLGAFGDDGLRLVSTLAGNLAMLVEHARLFEEVETARAELQQRAEALEEANVRLQELDRLKDQFLANMSHELRTPLNSIIGFSEVLIDGLVGEMTSEQKECLENVRSSGHHLLALISDILDISKIEAGRMELEPATFDVAELLAEVQATITPLIEKKSQVLKIEQAEGLPPLTADRFRVKQILLNLLSNAYKFTLVEGHITLSCRLADQTTMLFSVADTGIGIKPEDQEIIFEEFRQVDGSAAREMTGTGLGLAISKRLVEMHGGRIWVESEYGHGATFSLLLPLTGPLAAEPGAAGGTEQPSDSKTVLVVEDDRQFSDLLAFYLRREGYTPVQHYNGVGVLDHARRSKPALITLDVMLPDLDGWDVLRALKSDPLTKDIPVLVISVLENSELAFSLGAVDYLVKPVRRDDLHRVLGRLAAPAPPDRGVKVLVVDDDPGVVLLLRRMLPAGRYTLLPAYDGEQGLILARSEHPDVVLLDLLMPGMNGFEVLAALRADAQTAAIPVIVLTAKDIAPGERALLNEHVQGLVRKSALTAQSLLTELRRLEALAATPDE